MSSSYVFIVANPVVIYGPKNTEIQLFSWKKNKQTKRKKMASLAKCQFLIITDDQKTMQCYCAKLSKQVQNTNSVC